MARYTGPKQKIARRFKEPVFGHSTALERKPYGPGEHGRNRFSRKSEYAIQLDEKQKAKYTYGLLEKQFRNLYEKATRREGVTGELLMQMLESRLDNVVFRMGFAKTRRQARQLTTHRHIVVNGQVVNIPSFNVKPGDVISIRPKSKDLDLINEALQSYSANRYKWLETDKKSKTGKFLYVPLIEEIPENINMQFIIELYSK